MKKLSLVFVAVALAAVGCGTEGPEEAPALAQIAQEAACQPSALMWSSATSSTETCAGPWEFREGCVKADDFCGPSTVCKTHNSCDVATGAQNVTVQKTYGLVKHCEPNCDGHHCGHPICSWHDDGNAASNACNAAVGTAVEAQRNLVPAHLRNQVWFASKDSYQSGQNWKCNIRINVPTWQNKADASCGCAAFVPKTCLVPPTRCTPQYLPPKMSSAGLSKDGLYASNGSIWKGGNDVEGPRCLTCEHARNAAELFDCLSTTWQRLAVQDGGFEAQNNRHVLSNNWVLEGVGGTDIANGIAPSGVNSGFLWGGGLGWHALKQTVPVVAGTRYRVTANIQTHSAMSDGYFGVRLTGTYHPYNGNEVKFGPIGPWQRLEVIFDAPANATSMDVFIGNWNIAGKGDWTRVDDVRIEPINGPMGDAYRVLVNRKLKQLYNLFGENLDEPRRNTLKKLAFGIPGAGDNAIGCGDFTAPPAIPAACNNPSIRPQYDAARSTLQMCAADLDPAVSPDSASHDYNACDQNLILLTNLGNTYFGAVDRGCAGPELRAFAVQTNLELLRKQMEVIYAPAPDPSLQPMRIKLGSLPRQLAFLDFWYQHARSVQMIDLPAESVDALGDELSSAMRTLWDAVYKRENPFAAVKAAAATAGTTSAQMNGLLHDLTGTAFHVDQIMVDAAFTRVGSMEPDGMTLDRTPITGGPLLLLLSDALTPLSRRADDMSVFHDFACTFRLDCATARRNTPLVRTFELLASLRDPTAIADAINTHHPLAGWKPTFEKVAAQHAALAAALPTNVATADIAGLPAATRPLARILQHAASRSTSYKITGQFDPIARRTLASGVDVEARAAIIQEVQAGFASFDGEVQRYFTSLVSGLSSLVSEVDTQASAQTLRQQKLRITERWDQLAADLTGLRAAAAAEERRFASIVDRFQKDVSPAIDTGALYATGNTFTHDFDGASARFKKQNVFTNAQLAAFTIPNLTRGQMLSFEASGQYSPSCALTQTKLLSPVSGELTNLMAAGGSGVREALAGPDGYTLTWSNSGYTATAITDSDTNSAEVGVRGEMCATTGLIGDVSGVEAKACAYASASKNWSHSDSSSSGGEQRASANFASGLRLRSTPFSTFPAGALLFVIESSTGVKDVHVVQPGPNSVVVPVDGNGYFIVNDLGTCANPNEQRKVTVRGNVLIDAQTAAAGAIDAMAGVLATMRTLEDNVLAQGRLLPSDGAAARSEALALLDQRVDLDRCPPQVQRLFEAFLDKELLRVERQLEILSIEREMKLSTLDLRAIDEDTSMGAEKSRLQALVTRWALRNVDGERLRTSAVAMLTLTRTYFLPILELWYPAAIEKFRLLPDLDTLLDADVSTSVPAMAGHVNLALTKLYAEFMLARRGQKTASEQFPVVAVSFPNPYYAFGRGMTPSTYNRAEASQQYALWDAIAARGHAQLTIRPEDLYRQTDGSLSCYEHNPVIQKMAIYVVRPGEPDFGQLNAMPRKFDSWAAADQLFAQSSGPLNYTIEDSATQYNAIPVSYGEHEDLQANVMGDQDLASQRPIGLSPFSTFEIDFSRIATIEAAGGESGFDYASELIIFMQLDSKATGAPLSWILPASRKRARRSRRNPP